MSASLQDSTISLNLVYEHFTCCCALATVSFSQDVYLREKEKCFPAQINDSYIDGVII